MPKDKTRAEQDWLSNYEARFKEQLACHYDDPRIRGLARMRCRVWLDLALALRQRLGREGVALVQEARYRSAQEVAQEIRTHYGSDVQAIYRYYREFLPWHEPIWDVYLGDLPHRMCLRTKCQVGEYWQERAGQEEDALELCRIFCSWDEEVARQVNPDLQCEVKKWIGDGSPYCELVWTTSGEVA